MQSEYRRWYGQLSPGVLEALGQTNLRNHSILSGRWGAIQLYGVRHAETVLVDRVAG